eukprot:TRINITY_DN25633_c0_g1_i8.p8 TRINITY_DN25633_c0_g1~~TRINITY_DN25633_c0_g1_i8.p8  ORF type:complete len:101 (-),score=2.75 TRINITY_DN25633_c0_g1_i8:192-494(-)
MFVQHRQLFQKIKVETTRDQICTQNYWLNNLQYGNQQMLPSKTSYYFPLKHIVNGDVTPQVQQTNSHQKNLDPIYVCQKNCVQQLAHKTFKNHHMNSHFV